MATIRITSYGTRHHDNPTAPDPVVVDTTALPGPADDPQVRETLTQLTGRHPDVAAHVLAPPGAHDLITTARRDVEQRITSGEQHIDVHVHSHHGRHRAVAIAELLAADLSILDDYVHTHHRHINHPILPARTPA